MTHATAPRPRHRAVAGSDHVINCVGLLLESGRNTFDAVQDFGARAVAEATRAAGATLTHISAIGADEKSASSYSRTKARGEAAVLRAVPDAVILRPSIVFGPEAARRTTVFAPSVAALLGSTKVGPRSNRSRLLRVLGIHRPRSGTNLVIIRRRRGRVRASLPRRRGRRRIAGGKHVASN